MNTRPPIVAPTRPPMFPTTALRGVTDTVSAAKAIVNDPAFATVIGLINQLNAAEGGGGSSGGGSTAGIGLSAAVTPLRVVVYARKNPWVVPTAVAGVLGVPLLLGFLIGRRSSR